MQHPPAADWPDRAGLKALSHASLLFTDHLAPIEIASGRGIHARSARLRAFSESNRPDSRGSRLVHAAPLGYHRAARQSSQQVIRPQMLNVTATALAIIERGWSNERGDCLPKVLEGAAPGQRPTRPLRA
jgi:hypothetical protein